MRFVEARGIFQAVAERPVETDVRERDQGDRLGERRVEGETYAAKRKRNDGRMDEIVGRRAEPRAEEVGDKAEVRGEKQRREQQPGKARVSISGGCDGKKRKALRAQQDLYAAGRRSLRGLVTRRAGRNIFDRQGMGHFRLLNAGLAYRPARIGGACSYRKLHICVGLLFNNV